MRAGRTSGRYGNQSKVTRTERLVLASSIAITPASRSQAKARYLAYRLMPSFRSSPLDRATVLLRRTRHSR